jgi:hypothetical protein
LEGNVRSERIVTAILACLLSLVCVAGEPAPQPFPAAIKPLQDNTDPGPETFAPEPTERSASNDIYIEGPGDVRVYFDFQNQTDFHFLDRRKDTLTLGVSEAGVEQTFATVKAEGRDTRRVARHGQHIAVFQGGKLLTTAFDDRFQGGRTGFRMLSGGAPVNLKVEGRDEIHFSDDFMIAEGQPTQWRSNGNPKTGDFRVRSLRHPAMSANAFNYMGAGSNIHSVVGQPWWDQYRYQASLRGPVNGSIGLVFAYQDERNYGLFRWTARASKDDGRRELVRVRDGKEQVISSARGGYCPDLWYRVTLEMTYQGVSVMIDGHPWTGKGSPFLRVCDPYFAAGGAGVWCDVPVPPKPATDPAAQPYEENDLHDLMKQHAVFDDVAIDTLNSFEDDFGRTGDLLGGWHVGAGNWRVENGARVSLSADSNVSKALIGSPRWAEYQVMTSIYTSPGSQAGIVFLHRDESNYYFATAGRQELALGRVSAGKATILDKTTYLGPDFKGCCLQATINKGHIRASLIPPPGPENGMAANEYVVEAFESDTTLRGRAGLIVSGKGESQFTDFRVTFPPEAKSLTTVNAIFDREASMQDWSSPSNEWYPPMKKTIDGKEVTLMWHHSLFPGEVELRVEPHAVTDPDYEVAVSIAKAGSGKDNGYVFRLRGEPDGTRRLHLMRNGQKVTDKTIWGKADELSSIAIRRSGKFVTGIVNGRPALVYRDDAPLPGGMVAFYTRNISVKPEAVKITTDHCLNDVFTTAPVDWRPAGFAIAEVANRWQCSPNWSFFSLKNDRTKGKPAVLWSKRLYPGDTTVEFFVAHKMERERGEPYVYARDINVTICSDGQDLTKGYTFMWGGHNNRGSMILRNGVEVKHNNATIPTEHGNSRIPETDWHHHWFSVRVEKNGPKVTFRVDRFFENEPNEEMTFEDPQPLTGNRIAIWTYDHCILISRARISGEGGVEIEDPDFTPGNLKTPYDGMNDQ